MRYILKQPQPPNSIRDYIANQTPVGFGLDYATFSQTPSPEGGSRSGQLCRELTVEQFGLCAYTGAGIDARLGQVGQSNSSLMFKCHNEHLKPQSVCRAELMASGLKPGEDLGDDMDHRNIVAALEVSGGNRKVDSKDLFGATHRQNNPVPIFPTDPACDSLFAFDGNGIVSGLNNQSIATIDVLNLNHGTLQGWRANAINSFVEAIESREDAQRIIDATSVPIGGKLPEYCFAIRQVVQSMLEMSQS